MKCERAQKDICLLKSGELASVRREQLEQHLARCARCRRFAYFSGWLTDHQTAGLEPPTRVLAGLHARAVRESARVVHGARLRRAAPLAAAAAVLLVAAAAVWEWKISAVSAPRSDETTMNSALWDDVFAILNDEVVSLELPVFSLNGNSADGYGGAAVEL